MLVFSSRGFLALALVALAACGDNSMFGPNSELGLRLARIRWQNSGVDSYELTVSLSCFCVFGPDGVRVRVENGVVVSRTVVPTGAPLDAQLAPSYPDVPGLFAIIERARADGADYLDTKFDGTYGFPTVISIDRYKGTADDEAWYRAEGFEVLH